MLYDDAHYIRLIGMCNNNNRFEKKNDGYSLAGYMSAYPFFAYPDGSRMRLSQFFILPPFQKQGHGSTSSSSFLVIYVVVTTNNGKKNNCCKPFTKKCESVQMLETSRSRLVPCNNSIDCTV